MLNDKKKRQNTWGLWGLIATGVLFLPFVAYYLSYVLYGRNMTLDAPQWQFDFLEKLDESYQPLRHWDEHQKLVRWARDFSGIWTTDDGRTVDIKLEMEDLTSLDAMGRIQSQDLPLLDISGRVTFLDYEDWVAVNLMEPGEGERRQAGLGLKNGSLEIEAWDANGEPVAFAGSTDEVLQFQRKSD